MFCVFVGSIATSLVPITVRKSVFVVHVPPPLVDFHNPPAAAPAQMLFTLVGSIRTNVTRPAPPPVGAPVGPAKTHVLD